MIAALWLSVRAAAYMTGWTTGTIIAATARRLLPVPPVPALDPCPCICCAAHAALVATGRTESPWCDCVEFPAHQRCDCTPCRQQHRPCEPVP
jgi:hypothetical protein